MKRMRTLITVITLFISTAIFSQATPEIDLEITLDATPPYPWSVGQEGVFRVNVKNLSATLTPSSAYIRPLAAIPPNVMPFDEFGLIDGIVTSCAFTFFCAPANCYLVPELAPGQTASCNFPRRALQSFNNPGQSRWRVSMISERDPNLTNNEAQIPAGIIPPLRAVPVSRHAHFLLAGLMLVFGMVMSARRGE
jgi:hypothetical protein